MSESRVLSIHPTYRLEKTEFVYSVESISYPASPEVSSSIHLFRLTHIPLFKHKTLTLTALRGGEPTKIPPGP